MYSLDVDMSRNSNGSGVSAEKALSDRRSVSAGKVIASFYAIKYEFFLLCGLFFGLLALIKLFM